MKNTWKLAPLAVLAFVMFGCGGGGGAADPRPIAEGVLDALKNENFTAVYDYHAPWEHEMGEQMTGVKRWRMTEGYERWKDLKKNFEGDEGLDPKDKSEITGGEEKWSEASDAQRYAVFAGFYRVYTADDWEKRLKESDWYWAGRSINLKEEGEGEATFRYRNRYRDSITVTMVRDGGLWYLASAEINMAKEIEEKPKDD